MSARRTSRSSLSMPEGFEDVLFGTTGLLTVMLVWALTQIGVPEVSKATLDAMSAALTSAQAQRDAAEEALKIETRHREASEESADRARQAKKAAQAAMEKAEQDRSDLEPKPCDLVLCFDRTASQNDVLDGVRTTAASLSEVGSRLSPRFRVGVVTYGGDGVTQFPLTEITSTSMTGQPSAGMQALRAHLDGLKTVTGEADVRGGMKAAAEMLRAGSNSNSRQLLTVLGDVGCWEMGSESENVRSAKGQVEAYTGGGPRNRVLSIFTGKDPEQAYRAEAIEFFKGVARWAGPSQGIYTDDISQLSASIVEALFGNKE